MLFRTPYVSDSDVVSFSTGVDLSSAVERTQQHFRDETDINTLVKLYARTGVVPGADIPVMSFEVDEIIDYQTALNRVREADDAFMALPAAVRDRFENDPGLLLDFVHNVDNREEAVSLGLLPKPLVEPVSENSAPVNPSAAPVSES